MIIRKSIFRNSLWFGLESILDSVVSLALSIAVARVIGPVQLGYFIYLSFMVNLARSLGAFGPGSATRKYMTEYLGRDDRAAARSVFFTTLRWHIKVGGAFAALGVVLTFLLADPSQRTVACILLASMMANIVNVVPSQANMAAEDFARNVPGSIAGLAIYTVTVILTLIFGWGTIGLATGMLLRRGLELAMRLGPALRWVWQLPDAPAPAGLTRKMMAFSTQGLGIALLLIFVWDRSELFFLKHFSAIQEVTFYSVAFSITEALLLVPNVIGAAVSVRLMAESGRSMDGMGTLASSTLRQVALLVMPMYIGLAALSSAVVRLLYGPSYLPAIPVLMLALVMAIPKAFYWFPSAALQAADRQGIIFRWMLTSAVLNFGLDFLLIPRFGAAGAAIGNGVAQAAAVVILGVAAGRVFKMRLPWASLRVVLFAAMAMGVIVYLAVQNLSPILAVTVGPVLGVVAYIALLRLTGAFTMEDLTGLGAFERRLPVRLRSVSRRALEWLAGAPRVPQLGVELIAGEAEARNL